MLATVDAEGVPHVVPVCFTVVDETVVVPVDDVKAKSGRRLRRLENVEATGRAALLVEEWDAHDWSRLWWVRADCSIGQVDRTRAEEGLRRAYRQYELATFGDLLALRVERLVGWTATP